MAINDDRDIIKKIKEGDANSFVFIVRRYQKMVLNTVFKIVKNYTDAEDITQEIFIKVYQSLDKYRAEAEFSTWLYRIAYNTTISHLRKHKNELTAFEDNLGNISDEQIGDPIDELSTEQRLHYLDIALSKLPPEDALMITLFYINDRSMQQISEITGHSLANVKVKLHRIRKIMNVEINKLIAQ